MLPNRTRVFGISDRFSRKIASGFGFGSAATRNYFVSTVWNWPPSCKLQGTLENQPKQAVENSCGKLEG